MSRRTRTKIRRNQDNYGFGTSHHNEYASSNSHFPKPYSALGKQIKFPSTAVAFLSEGKLTFYGTLDLFQQKITELSEYDVGSIHTVNIGIKGRVQQKMSQMNNCIFAFSMIICCVSQIFNFSCFRDKFYTKYESDDNTYKKIMVILQKMWNLQTAMFTFQDNFMNKRKFQILDSHLSKMNLKSLTLRNLTYFMWPNAKISSQNGQIQEFTSIKNSKIDFIFVWQKHIVKYNSKQILDEQKQSINDSLCDEI